MMYIELWALLQLGSMKMLFETSMNDSEISHFKDFVDYQIDIGG